MYPELCKCCIWKKKRLYKLAGPVMCVERLGLCFFFSSCCFVIVLVVSGTCLIVRWQAISWLQFWTIFLHLTEASIAILLMSRKRGILLNVVAGQSQVMTKDRWSDRQVPASLYVMNMFVLVDMLCLDWVQMNSTSRTLTEKYSICLNILYS